jgi:Sec-independent protein translocase protein TatA
MFNFIKNISPTEVLVIALIFIVFFGSKIVTNIGKSGGETMKAIKNIKKSFSEAIEDDDEKSEKGGVNI